MGRWAFGVGLHEEVRQLSFEAWDQPPWPLPTATIQRAVAQELHHFQLVRGREGLNDVDHVDLDAFVSKHTNAPQRAVQGLRWFSNAGQLG